MDNKPVWNEPEEPGGREHLNCPNQLTCTYAGMLASLNPLVQRAPIGHESYDMTPHTHLR